MAFNLDPDLWSHTNLSDIVWYCDPDKVARFYASVIEHETDTQTGIIKTINDLFDPDICPKQYLPYLANMVGLRLDQTDREETWRAQIRTAVAWYKEKGKLRAFDLVFYTMGITTEIYPLWIDEQGNVDRYPHDASWKPHARIDIVMNSYSEWRRYLPDNLQYVLQRMEEVRPIHVLVRSFFLGWDVFDVYPFDLIHDIDEDILIADFNDEWEGAYFGYCGLWHFEFPRANILRDGAGYDWQYPYATEFADSPPASPAVPSRYIIGVHPTGAFAGHSREIADWDGATWTFTPSVIGMATWVLHDPQPIGDGDPGGWIAYAFEDGYWTPKWTLYDFPKRAPGPFFRECDGALHGVAGPIDDMDVIIRWDPDPDPFSYCMFHDALEPDPVNGGIQLRDGRFMRNCGETADDLVIGIVPVTGSTWDSGGEWDSGLEWD